MKTKTLLTALFSLAFLSACNDDDKLLEKERESFADVEKALPQGCHLVDAGWYSPRNSLSIRVVFVKCSDGTVATLSRTGTVKTPSLASITVLP